MSEPTDPKKPDGGDMDSWDFAGTRRHHLEQGPYPA